MENKLMSVEATKKNYEQLLKEDIEEKQQKLFIKFFAKERKRKSNYR